jgi:hypothetical protein
MFQLLVITRSSFVAPVSLSFQLSRLIAKKAEGSQLQILIYVFTRDPAYSVVNILHSYRLYIT